MTRVCSWEPLMRITFGRRTCQRWRAQEGIPRDPWNTARVQVWPPPSPGQAHRRAHWGFRSLLRKTFVGYQVFEYARVANVPESIMTNSAALSYRKGLDDLAAPSWLVDTFHRHLNIHPWPLSDEAQGQSIELDLVKSGQGSGVSWSCGFCPQSVAGHVVGHECLQMGSTLFHNPPFWLFLYLSVLT